jgi:hypothetical protein
MNKEVSKNFGVIEGGKSKEAVTTKDERKDALKKDIANQEKLNESEKSELSKRIKKEIILEIKSFVLDFTGKMLKDEEAEFINSKISGLSDDDQEAKEEICQKFPELTELLDQILKNVGNVSKSLSDLSSEEIKHFNKVKKQIDEIENISQFDELDFGKLDDEWKEIIDYKRTGNFSMEKNYFFYKKVKWEDQKLFLSALKKSQLSEDEEVLFDSIYFQLSKRRAEVSSEKEGLFLNAQDNPHLEFSLTINYLDGINPCVEEEILKNDPDKTLPTGMTELIYQKIFEYIQHQAKKDKKIYQHRITKNLSMSEQSPLNDEQWEKIFLPIIEKAGYQRFSANTWRKNYQPQ